VACNAARKIARYAADHDDASIMVEGKMTGCQRVAKSAALTNAAMRIVAVFRG
jgi:hypothetical protein